MLDITGLSTANSGEPMSDSGDPRRPILGPGDEGSTVLEVQKLLRTHGFNPGPPDWVFGRGLQKTLAEFQEKMELKPDGIVGPATWEALQGIDVGLSGASVLPDDDPDRSRSQHYEAEDTPEEASDASSATSSLDDVNLEVQRVSRHLSESRLIGILGLPENFRFSRTTSRFLHTAIVVSNEIQKELSSYLLYLAFACFPFKDRHLIKRFLDEFVRPRLDASGEWKQVENLVAALSDKAILLDPDVHYKVTQNIRRAVTDAAKISNHTLPSAAGKRRQGVVNLRHLFAGLLTFYSPEKEASLYAPLEQMGTSIDEVRRTFLEFAEKTFVEDDLDGWREDFQIFLSPSASGLARASYDTETAKGTDFLDIKPDVNALAMLIAAKDVRPPLSIGLFGDWGSGKSFFMGKLSDRVRKIADDMKAGEKLQQNLAFYKNIEQVEFNAWHYSKGNLWASLVDHLFSTLSTRGLSSTPRAHWLQRMRQQRRAEAVDDARKRLQHAIDRKEDLGERINALKRGVALDERDRISEGDLSEGEFARIRSKLTRVAPESGADADRDLFSAYKDARKGLTGFRSLFKSNRLDNAAGKTCSSRFPCSWSSSPWTHDGCHALSRPNMESFWAPPKKEKAVQTPRPRAGGTPRPMTTSRRSSRSHSGSDGWGRPIPRTC